MHSIASDGPIASTSVQLISIFLFNLYLLIYRFLYPLLIEINEYAIHIGINPQTEPHLLYLAREGLLHAIPSEWQIWYDFSFYCG